jgi:hypothetical protein
MAFALNLLLALCIVLLFIWCMCLQHDLKEEKKHARQLEDHYDQVFNKLKWDSYYRFSALEDHLKISYRETSQIAARYVKAGD